MQCFIIDTDKFKDMLEDDQRLLKEQLEESTAKVKKGIISFNEFEKDYKEYLKKRNNPKFVPTA